MRPQNSPRAKAPRSRSFEVQEENTLMPFLLQALHDQSRTAVKSFLAHKLVQVNNRVTTQFDTPLKPGDTVTVGMNKNAAPFHHPMLNILYEDEHLLVVEKASGLLSMGTERDKTKTAYYILNNYVKNKDPRNHIFILHRLDKETSGVMMFAKNKKVQEILQKNWNEMIRERKYVAVIEGAQAPGTRTGEILHQREQSSDRPLHFFTRREIGHHELHDLKIEPAILTRGT